MLQHSIIRYLAFSLGLAFSWGSALAQDVGERPEIFNVRPQTIIGPQTAPRCQLTNAATILVNAAVCASNPTTQAPNLNTIILTQDSVFAFPTGLPTGGNFQFGFRIDHGTATCGGGGTRQCTATFAAGYNFPSLAMLNGQPVLSTGIDFVWCVSESGSPPTVVDCNASMLAMTPVGGWVLKSHTIAGGSNITTTGIDTTGADLIVVSLSWWVGGGGTTAMADLVGGNSNSWTKAVSGLNPGDVAQTEIWFTRPTHVGTGHTFSCGATAQACRIAVEAWSGSVATPLDQTNNAGTDSATTLASGSVTPGLSSELIVTSECSNNGTAFSVNTGFTISDNSGFDGNFSGGLAYLIQGTAAAVNPTWSWTGGASASAAVATFK